MSKRALLWLIPTLLFLCFVTWYTDFGGPLKADEIAAFEQAIKENGGSGERLDNIRAFMQADSGRQFLMINVLDMNDNPPDVAGAPPGASAWELMGLYMEHMYPQLIRRACHPVLMGTAVFSNMDTVGVTGADNWTDGALLRYRSRRSMMEIVTNPAFMGKHDYKMAALDKTIAYPIEMNLYYSDLRLMLGLLLLAITAVLDILLFGRKRTN